MCLFKGYSYNRVSAPVPPAGAALFHLSYVACFFLTVKDGRKLFQERKIMKKIKIKGRVKIAVFSSLNLDIIYYNAFYLL